MIWYSSIHIMMLLFITIASFWGFYDVVKTLVKEGAGKITSLILYLTLFISKFYCVEMN